VSLKFADIFKEKLGAKVIIKHNQGHFSGPVDDTKSVTILSEVIQEIR
jgi:hypothetical protein